MQTITSSLALLSLSLPIALSTIPSSHRRIIPFYISEGSGDMPCYSFSPEQLERFMAATGFGSLALLLTVVLGPLVVRNLLRQRQRLSAPREPSSIVVIPLLQEKKSLAFGENPDYHNIGFRYRPPGKMPPQSQCASSQLSAADELPPCACCPAETNPSTETVGSRNSRAPRRSPFKPILPGMKTMIEEGVDPVTGHRWRRKVVVYTGGFGDSLGGASATTDKQEEKKKAPAVGV
ncbi:unnamed protein product [Tuber melanosporum]|uniref:(Perigord truffle) hypothetical protein n=1 Tax=Tuber melanosporum (strain Mel28) TaxID=656061 RepID=D5GAT5_TUBMM|nr:uncharacterized protein GSTUM_00005295001 [Tuber melanosporum]CAZ81628.1 unnamed protein product [Tuber melanosporum]